MRTELYEYEGSGDVKLSYCYNITRAVAVIDKYCVRGTERGCLFCPLRKMNPSGQYTCTVVHKKWDSAGFQKQKAHYEVSWITRKQLLDDNGWKQVSFGPNVMWYKHRQYREQKMLKNCSDEEFFGTVSPAR